MRVSHLHGSIVIAAVLTAFFGGGCRSDVLLGEQRTDADVSPNDGDVVVDADADAADADADADFDDEGHDADQDRETDEADVEDGDADDPDVDVEPLMTCLQAMLCVAGCADDLLCAATCADGVCESSMDAFITLSECALPDCASLCMDFSSTDCHQCVLERCPPTALTSCLGAEC